MTSHRCCLASANVAIASSPTPAVAVEMIETSAHASITPCDEVAMAETPISDLSAASLKTSGWIVEPTTHAHDTSAFVSYDMDVEMPAEDASDMAPALPASPLSASHMHAQRSLSSDISSSGSTPLPDAIHMRRVRTAWLDRIANLQSTTTSVSQPSLDTVQDEEPSPLATASPCSPRAAASSPSPRALLRRALRVRLLRHRVCRLLLMLHRPRHLLLLRRALHLHLLCRLCLLPLRPCLRLLPQVLHLTSAIVTNVMPF